MRKIILAAIAALVSANGFAQIEEGDFFITPKAGFNVSNTHSRSGEYQYNNWKPDFMVGIGFGYQVSDKWAVTADILYCEQGVREKSEMARTDDGRWLMAQDITSNYNYVNVPVMASYYLTEKLAIKAGVQIGFLTHACEKFTIDNEKYDVDVNKYCNNIDFAIPVGISLDVTDNVQLDFRYVYGLSDIVKDKNNKEYPYQCKNQAITLTIGYRFGL